MGRSLDVLRRDQEAILEGYRTSQSTALATLADQRVVDALTAGSYSFGRVAQVVTSDETYGPHVWVVRQVWSGTPPVPTDAVLDQSRGYPLPGVDVTSFTTDQLVRMNYVSGAILIEPLAN